MRRFAFIAALVLAAFVSWVAFSSQSITLRYRLTLVVDDGGHQVTGTSVIETVWGGVAEYFPQLGPLYGGRRWAPIAKGEAVTVDLGTRGVLFMLLFSPNYGRRPHSTTGPAELLVTTFGCPSIGSATWKLLHRIRDTRKPVNVPLQLLPMLVRFRDINDPKTVEAVDPGDLAASFGPGVSLVRATLEVTDAPVTTGIKNELHWLNESNPEARLVRPNGKPIYAVPRAHLLTFGDFKRG